MVRRYFIAFQKINHIKLHAGYLFNLPQTFQIHLDPQKYPDILKAKQLDLGRQSHWFALLKVETRWLKLFGIKTELKLITHTPLPVEHPATPIHLLQAPRTIMPDTDANPKTS